MEGHATHLPMLLRAVALTTGPVLEIGCGSYSTLTLHEVCRGRRLVTLETNKAWFSNFKRLASQTHEMLTAESYEAFDALVRGVLWDVVLVDHGPPKRRAVELSKLHHAKFVVAHDTEYIEKGWYGYDVEIPKFKYSYTYDKLYPWTTVVSDLAELGEFERE